MLKHSMAKAVHSKKGGKSSQLSTKNRMLWVAMYHQKSPCTTRMLADNINGPSERSLQRGAAKLDKANHSVSGKSIIEMTNEEAKENMCEFVKELYRSSKKRKSHPVRVSYSIDATAVASGLFIHGPSNKLVGGAYPDHSLSVPPKGEDLRELIDTFDVTRGLRKRACEVKLATVVVQNVPSKDISPMYQFLAQPQTKNFNSRFNYRAVDIMLEAEAELRYQGYNFGFLSAAVDGVSCDSKFVKDVLLRFLKGEMTYTAMTDTNHNGKNLRYQALLGGNAVKTIGCVLIDGGLVKAANAKQEIWRVKDWACDNIVLRLYSADTVFKILNLMNGQQDATTVAVTCLHLYFMRVHLVAVNCKGVLKAQERVAMIWHCLLWVLHIDGVCITTKRNLLSECVSLCFLIMRDDVKEPHLLTSEPSEHSNALLRSMQREFTVKDLLILLNKLLRIWRSFTRGGLRIARRAHGYASTISATLDTHDEKQEGSVSDKFCVRPVNVVHSAIYEPTSQQIWTELEGILKKSTVSMRRLLKSVCNLKEEHPMMAPFPKDSSLKDFISRCESVFKSKDGVFKKEAAYDNEPADNDIDNLPNDMPVQELGPNINHLTQEANSLIKELIGDEVDKSLAQEEDGDDATGDEIILEDTLDKDGASVYRSFIDVVSVNSCQVLSEGVDKNPILKSMNLMALKNREKGSGVCRFNTLNGRWFKKEMSASFASREEVESTIERGRLVKISGSEDFFLVFEVWKEMGNKKRYPSEKSDILVWPLATEIKETKKYRIGLRRMAYKSSTNQIQYMSYGESKNGEVEDGQSVHSTYIMVKDLKIIRKVYIKIDI